MDSIRLRLLALTLLLSAGVNAGDELPIRERSTWTNPSRWEENTAAESAQAEHLAKEALKAYAALAKAVRTSDAASLHGRTLIMGNTLKNVRDKHLTYLKKCVAVASSYDLAKLSPSALVAEEETIVKGKRATRVIVRIYLPNAKTRAKKAIPRMSGQTVVGDSLVLHLERRDDKWFWVPFNWK